MTDDLLRILARHTPGPYTHEVRAQPQPAAGANPSIVTVPGGQIWRTEFIHARIQTSAVAGSRLPLITIDDQTNIVGEFTTPNAIGPNSTNRATWGNFGAYAVDAVIGGSIIILPPIVLWPGWRIALTYPNLDAADQISQYTITIERLDQPPITMQHEFGIGEEQLNAAFLAAAQGGNP